MKLIIMINTAVLALLLATTNTLAETAKPYGVFNPLAMFNLLPKTHVQGIDSSLYNYGNKGYDFVVEALPVDVFRAPKQVARLEKH